jgi:hypothetical protein
MQLLRALTAVSLLAAVACHPGPVIDTGPGQQGIGGTVAGIVSTEQKAPLAGRKVTAINTQTNARFEATTGPNGGYTIKVPEGTYKLEVELQAGESIAKHPGETRINKSDLDAQRHFIIAGAKGK